jgi:hypothetical protein
MTQIRSSDAFGLSLIRENPDPNDPKVKEIVAGLAPAAKKVAKRILESAKSRPSGPLAKAAA